MHNDELRSKLTRIDIMSSIMPAKIKLISHLADGGQGIVYKGLIDGCESAIKVYYPEQLTKRIEREVNALSKIHHPNLVELLWAGNVTIDNQQIPVVATRLVPGEVLEKLIKSRSLSENEVGNVVYDVINAIGCLWSYRIVHRDLKPSNIMVKPDGRACVIDLGVARHITQSTLTALGFTWGTLGYMSPEQTKSVKQLTCKSDIYALGVIAVECALGNHPTRQDQFRLLQLGLHLGLPPKIAGWKIAPVIMTMLDPSPTKRPLPSDIIQTLKGYNPVN